MPSRDSILAICVLRAGHAIVRENIAAGRDPNIPATRRETAKAIWQATMLGSTAAALIIEWALALDDREVDELGIERFGDWANASLRTIYRRVDDFRRVFPDEKNPNAIALMVLAEARRRGEKPSPAVTIAAA